MKVRYLSVLVLLLLAHMELPARHIQEKGKKQKRDQVLAPGPQGIPGPIGPAGPVGFISPYTIFVDQNAKGGGNGSLALPFNTIQEAVSSLVGASDAKSLQQSVTIFVASGIYKENVTVTVSPKRIALKALGEVILQGSLRWIFAGPGYDGIHSKLSVSGFHITKDLQVIGAPITADLSVADVEIDGDVTFDEHVCLDLFFLDSTFHGSVSANGAISNTIALQSVANCRFEKPIFVGSYQLIRASTLMNGMEVRVGPQLNALAGFIDTFFSGTFSAQESATLVVDGYTNYWFDSYGGNTAKVGANVTKKVIR